MVNIEMDKFMIQSSICPKVETILLKSKNANRNVGRETENKGWLYQFPLAGN